MKPVRFKDQTGILGKPSDMADEQCSELPIKQTTNHGMDSIESVWELSDADLEVIKSTKRIRIGVLGINMAPIYLQVEPEVMEKTEVLSLSRGHMNIIAEFLFSYEADVLIKQDARDVLDLFVELGFKSKVDSPYVEGLAIKKLIESIIPKETIDGIMEKYYSGKL